MTLAEQRSRSGESGGRRAEQRRAKQSGGEQSRSEESRVKEAICLHNTSQLEFRPKAAGQSYFRLGKPLDAAKNTGGAGTHPV